MYERLKAKSLAELIHVALNLGVHDPEKMEKEQLIEAILTVPVTDMPKYKNEHAEKEKFYLGENVEKLESKDEVIFTTKDRLGRAERLLIACIKDIFKILTGEIK